MLPNDDCVISEQVCCTSLYDIAQHILSGLYEGLLDCFQQTPCNPGGLLAYVTMGEGDDLVLDAVTVALTSIEPSYNTVARNDTSPFGLYRATFTVRLLESGWPMAFEENGEIFVPDPVIQNAVARHAFGHGERMYRRLTYMASHGECVPTGVACSKVEVTSLRPLNPSGGTVGWETTLVLALPWGMQ